jgi:translation initiation factor eIF-2B subunit delta
VLAECSKSVDAGETELEELGLKGADLIPDGGCFATISTSESVRALAAAATRGGRECRAIVAESRPSCEGVDFATSLPTWGVPVTLVVDAALPGLLGRCQLVLVGADSISEDGFVNKVGTYPLALAAREAGVPLYVASLSDKLLPAAIRGRTDRVWDPGEVLNDPPPGVTVENRYFERVPLSLVTGIVTERGLVAPADVPAMIAERPVSPALLGLLFPRAVETTT